MIGSQLFDRLFFYKAYRYLLLFGLLLFVYQSYPKRRSDVVNSINNPSTSHVSAIINPSFCQLSLARYS